MEGSTGKIDRDAIIQLTIKPRFDSNEKSYKVGVDLSGLSHKHYHMKGENLWTEIASTIARQDPDCHSQLF